MIIPKYFVALVEKELRSYEMLHGKFISAVLPDPVVFQEHFERSYACIGEKDIKIYKIGVIQREAGTPINVFYFPTVKFNLGNNSVNIEYNYNKIIEQINSNPFPTIPSFVITLVKEDAIRKGYECPIIYEAITLENSIVTSCYHVFTRDAFVKWQETNISCPTCRIKCTYFDN